MDQPTHQLEWLPLEVAARMWGYSLEGLRRRLRQLRQHGYVADLGRVPDGYTAHSEADASGKVKLLWANPRTYLISSAVPAGLLNPKKGFRKEALKPKADKVSQQRSRKKKQ